MNPSKIHFDHEKLHAYQRSVEFVAWASQLLEAVPAKLAVFDQLERASTSVPLNIAEGNAKFTPPDRCRYWDAARGSALECAACLDVLVAKGKVSLDRTEEGKRLLCDTVSLLIGLCRSVSPNGLGEETTPYRTSAGDQESEYDQDQESSRTPAARFHQEQRGTCQTLDFSCGNR